jgi:uncharacterized protein (DUF58 family)
LRPAAETVSRVEPRRAAVVLLTSVVDLAAAEMLRAALLDLARRHRVLLAKLESYLGLARSSDADRGHEPTPSRRPS